MYNVTDTSNIVTVAAAANQTFENVDGLPLIAGVNTVSTTNAHQLKDDTY
jgi:NADP-dependent 3-hydroxy acid dehydrogenase YdfG